MTSFYRPNFNSEYQYGENSKCFVTLHPLQKFELVEELENKVVLEYKIVRLEVDKETFKKNWQQTNNRRGLDLGEKVIRLQKAGRGQNEIAKELGCSVSYVRKFWQQPRKPIDYGMLRSLIVANWSFEEILKELNFQTKADYTGDDLIKIFKEMGVIIKNGA